jgi:hypothetical protein
MTPSGKLARRVRHLPGLIRRAIGGVLARGPRRRRGDTGVAPRSSEFAHPLRQYNRRSGEVVRIQMRTALPVGPVGWDAEEFIGHSVAAVPLLGAVPPPCAGPVVMAVINAVTGLGGNNKMLRTRSRFFPWNLALAQPRRASLTRDVPNPMPLASGFRVSMGLRMQAARRPQKGRVHTWMISAAPDSATDQTEHWTG